MNYFDYQFSFNVQESRHTFPIVSGDIGMLKRLDGTRKIAVVLRVHTLYIKVFLPKTNRQKRVAKNLLLFPHDYFQKRKYYQRDCATQLRSRNLVVKISFISEFWLC